VKTRRNVVISTLKARIEGMGQSSKTETRRPGEDDLSEKEKYLGGTDRGPVGGEGLPRVSANTRICLSSRRGASHKEG